MKMATWRQLVRATSDRITDDDRRIDRQRQLIEEMNRDGQDVALAEQALSVMLERNHLLRESRQRLLDGMPGSQPSHVHDAERGS